MKTVESLNAEALYLELLRSLQQLLASYPKPPRLVGVASGGAWLAERLQKGIIDSKQTKLAWQVEANEVFVVFD